MTTDESAAGKLNYLRLRKVGDCTRCPLHQNRTKVVFGEGNSEADVMFVGEAPGNDEDRTGRPFVGRAGKLLGKMLGEVGLSRQDVYIANVIKCRPEENRDPTPEEVDTCSKFLQVQIALIRPRVLITLGRFAANLLSGQSGLAMRDLRKRAWLYEHPKTDLKLPVCALYHPAYVLRQGPRPESTSVYESSVEDLRAALAVMESGVLPEPLEQDPEPEPAEPEASILEMFGVE